MGQHSRVTRTVLGRLVLAGLFGLAAFTLMLFQGLVPVPNAVNPFMPLDIRDEPKRPPPSFRYSPVGLVLARMFMADSSVALAA